MAAVASVHKHGGMTDTTGSNWHVHAQLCMTLCDPMDCRLSASSVHGIFQARILEWDASFSSRGSSWSRDQTCGFCIGRQILYHWTTWEALSIMRTMLYNVSGRQTLSKMLATILLFVWPFKWTGLSKLGKLRAECVKNVNFKASKEIHVFEGEEMGSGVV